MTTHTNTPTAHTPYSLHTAYDCRYSPAIEEIVIIGQGVGIAKILKSGRSGQDQETAQFIVAACNSYAANQATIAALVEALALVEARLSNTANAFYVSGRAKDMQRALDGWRDDAHKARAALQLAKEGSK